MRLIIFPLRPLPPNMPDPESCLIICRISVYCLMSLLTSATVVPDPRDILRRRLAFRILWSERSSPVIESMIDSVRFSSFSICLRLLFVHLRHANATEELIRKHLHDL